MFILFHMLTVFTWGFVLFKAMSIKKKTKKALKENMIKKEEAVKKYNIAFFMIVASTVISSLIIRLITCVLT